MSALREALERIESHRVESHRVGRPTSPAPARARNPVRAVPVDPSPPPLRYTPAVVEPESAPLPPPVAAPVSIGASTQTTAPSSEQTPLDAAAAVICRNFAAGAVVALVGCELSVPLAILAANLAEALRRRADGLAPIRLEVLAPADVVPQAERLRAADGVLLVVEFAQTSARAADVTAAVVRAQGVTIAGVIALR